MSPAFVNVCYLIAAVIFILGLKGLTHPRTAVKGNLMGAGAMLLAIVVTLLDQQVIDYRMLTLGLTLGTAIGIALAVTIQMTSMPQLVALFNGLGGAASVFVAGGYLSGKTHAAALATGTCSADVLTATAASGLIGAVTLSGSLVAFGKLQGLKFVKDIRFSGQQLANLGLVVFAVILCLIMVLNPSQAVWIYWLMVIVSLALGYLLVISIGGADMPVVISLLNSYSGLAASATGFVLSNNLLIIAGSLVGASGLILTRIMCVAMNRSLANVLFARLQPVGDGSGPSADDVYVNVKKTSADEVAMMMDVAQKVAIIPGYGMAVAQAQHAVRDLTNLLTAQDIDVQFGIHPVAGRMPGHMNVLLAEADIPYERLQEMDDMNSMMEQIDVAIVLGANDVVNPVANTDPSSPIAGMPIIEVDKAKTVVVIKRSLSPGFAGIPNPLFAADNAVMLFGDGKAAIVDIVKALRDS